METGGLSKGWFPGKDDAHPGLAPEGEGLVESL